MRYKKILLGVLGVGFALSLSLGLSACFVPMKSVVRYFLPLYSKGLQYELNEDGNSYCVAGIGSCEDIKIVIPPTYKDLPVTSIKKGSFFGDNDHIVKVVIPDSVTTIGSGAFKDCTFLTDVNIPDSVTTIGSHAFSSCTFLTEIHIPESVTSIGKHAFSYDKRLKRITVDEDNAAYKSIDGNLYTKDGTTLIQYAIGKTDEFYQTPDGVLTVSDGAFLDGENMISVKLGDSVTTVEESAFDGCIGLVGVEIGKGVTTIQKSTFSLCKNLSDVLLSDSVRVIEDYAFSNCSFLEEIVIPKSVTSIDKDAFNACERLENMTVDEGNETYLSIDGNLYSKDGKTFIQYMKGKKQAIFTLPSGVIEIGEYAFSRANNLVEVVIPDSVTKIGAWAFLGCKGLRRVVIGNGVKEIGELAFSGCYKLSDVVMGNGVISIERRAFADCTNLKSVIIPKSVEKMGDNVFYNDSRLTIYCEAKQRPSGWSKEWNSQKRPVVWSYEGDLDVEIEN